MAESSDDFKHNVKLLTLPLLCNSLTYDRRRCFTSSSSKQSPIQEAVPKVPKVDASVSRTRFQLPSSKLCSSVPRKEAKSCLASHNQSFLPTKVVSLPSCPHVRFSDASHLVFHLFHRIQIFIAFSQHLLFAISSFSRSIPVKIPKPQLGSN